MRNWNPYENDRNKNKTVMAFSNPSDTRFVEPKSLEQLEEEGYFDPIEEEGYFDPIEEEEEH